MIYTICIHNRYKEISVQKLCNSPTISLIHAVLLLLTYVHKHAAVLSFAGTQLSSVKGCAVR